MTLEMTEPKRVAADAAKSKMYEARKKEYDAMAPHLTDADRVLAAKKMYEDWKIECAAMEAFNIAFPDVEYKTTHNPHDAGPPYVPP